uniref:Zn(2)-C6 fungal-type domain-containing protein n=1 Tax=Ganoderma boninense TaxID=34458 RepID=A0A5K1JUP9_9APHY|nr:Zn(2)-C6 fungal-type domain-containing protein [Ganoderma boninense]
MSSSKAYRGPVRKLVVGIDVGTTFSGVSYAILDPGEVPRIYDITCYPGQENEAGHYRIPSILYYRPDGTLHSAGAEAAKPDMDFVAEDEDLTFVEWFKLHLRPERLDSSSFSDKDLPPLPRNKTIVAVFADFLGYLFAIIGRYICERHGSGESIWNEVKDHIEFVLPHPNGWEGLQQSKMRQAAVLAGLIPDTSAGHSRIHFVTEGEASLNFCINNGLTNDTMRDGKSIIIIDAGGGTVDISSYRFLSTSPISVEEITSPACTLQGSTRVNLRFSKFLKGHLASSVFCNDEDIKLILNAFERETKPMFEAESVESHVKFGKRKDHDDAVNISRGRLTLSGRVLCIFNAWYHVPANIGLYHCRAKMASFFRPAVDSILRVIEQQRDMASSTLSTAFLVGGFAASTWLYSTLKKELESSGVTLYRPDSQTSKAVANGAIYFYLDHFVSSRVVKTTYGTKVCTEFRPGDLEHLLRYRQKIVRPSGRVVLPNAFSMILQKGTRVREGEEISESFMKEAHQPSALNNVSSVVIVYQEADPPEWVDVKPG